MALLAKQGKSKQTRDFVIILRMPNTIAQLGLDTICEIFDNFMKMAGDLPLISVGSGHGAPEKIGTILLAATSSVFDPDPKGWSEPSGHLSRKRKNPNMILSLHASSEIADMTPRSMGARKHAITS